MVCNLRGGQYIFLLFSYIHFIEQRINATGVCECVCGSDEVGKGSGPKNLPPENPNPDPYALDQRKPNCPQKPNDSNLKFGCYDDYCWAECIWGLWCFTKNESGSKVSCKYKEDCCVEWACFETPCKAWAG